VLDARDHFLADVTAFVEIDAGQLVHVGFVRKGAAIVEIHAAARHAERDAVGVIGVGIGRRRAQIDGGLGVQMWRQHAARTERRQAWVGIRQPVFA